MQAVDRAAIEEWGIPGLVLMENAALGVVEAIAAHYPAVESVTLFVGPGNNGGDGLAIARHLTLRGYRVHVVLLQWSRNKSTDSELQYDLCRRQGVPLLALESVDDLAQLGPAVFDAELWVDAVFGTGLTRPAEGLFARALTLLAERSGAVLAVDLPSGLNASTGDVDGPCARADLSVTFAAPKWAHVFRPAADLCGEVVVADLGVPQAVIEEAPGYLNLLLAGELSAYLMDPMPESHKGDLGHCLVVAGSPGKSGAAVLATRAAVVSGAGLVTTGIPKPLLATLEGASIESMSLGLSSDRSGCLTVDAADQILAATADKQTLAIGPGLGTSGTTKTAVRTIIEACELPLVVDADGLNALVGAPELLRRRTGPTIATPHPGEAARLFGESVATIQAQRVEFARRMAMEYELILILKGHQTVIAEPDGEVFINSTGKPRHGHRW